MPKLKECPRCKRGSIAFDQDQYGWYEYCIQCGYSRDLIGMDDLEEQPAGGRKERESRARNSGKRK